MNDAFLVKKSRRVEKLLHNSTRFLLREIFLATNSLKQFAAPTQLHYHVKVQLKRIPPDLAYPFIVIRNVRHREERRRV